MSTYAQERSAWYREHHGRGGRRKARVTLSSARILAMLGPRPWEAGAGEFTVNGQNVSWAPAYDERILAQSSGLGRTDRLRIEAGFAAAGRARTRVMGRTTSRLARRSGRR